MENKALRIISQRFEAANTDGKVLIYKVGERIGTPEHPAPFAEIPVHERKSDREACLLALEWLREHRYITTREYLRDVEKFLFKQHDGHPTKAVDHESHPGRPNGKTAHDPRMTRIH
jgi:hypothetical protein